VKRSRGLDAFGRWRVLVAAQFIKIVLGKVAKQLCFRNSETVILCVRFRYIKKMILRFDNATVRNADNYIGNNNNSAMANNLLNFKQVD
jgi:hypothetical protein